MLTIHRPQGDNRGIDKRPSGAHPQAITLALPICITSLLSSCFIPLTLIAHLMGLNLDEIMYRIYIQISTVALNGQTISTFSKYVISIAKETKTQQNLSPVSASVA